MAGMRAQLDTLDVLPGQGDPEVSNTSSSADEVRTSFLHGPSPTADARVLIIPRPNTEKNTIAPLFFPAGTVFPSGTASRSPSPSHAMGTQMVRSSSPAQNRVARFLWPSLAIGNALIRQEHRSHSAGSGSVRRGLAGAGGNQKVVPVLDATQLRAPPPRRRVEVPPYNVAANGASHVRAHPADKPRGHAGSVTVVNQPGSPTPSNIFVIDGKCSQLAASDTCGKT